MGEGGRKKRERERGGGGGKKKERKCVHREKANEDYLQRLLIRLGSFPHNYSYTSMHHSSLASMLYTQSHHSSNREALQQKTNRHTHTHTHTHTHRVL